MRRLRFSLTCLAMALSLDAEHASANPRSWGETVIDVPGFPTGAVEGVDLALVNLDDNARPEMVLAAYIQPVGPGSPPSFFIYKIGWNMDSQGNAVNWSNDIQVPGVDAVAQGVGLGFANLDNNQRPEMVLIAYHDDACLEQCDADLDYCMSQVGSPGGPLARQCAQAFMQCSRGCSSDTFRYRVGWNLDGQGVAASWSNRIAVPGVGNKAEGSGAQLFDLDANGRPEMILMAYDSSGRDKEVRYSIGWNLNSQGGAANWVDWRRIAGFEVDGQGAGLSIADLDRNGRPELLAMVYNLRANMFRYRVGYNLTVAGVPTHWGNDARVQGVAVQAQGAGADLADLDGDGWRDLVVVAYGNWSGTPTFRYRIGWGFDGAPPVLRLLHSPLHPSVNDVVTYTAAALDPHGLAQIQIWVEGQLVQTCANSPCVATAGPYPNRDGATVAYAARAEDQFGGWTWTGYRAFAVGTWYQAVVPISVAGSPSDKYDIVFVQDDDSYGGNRRTCTVTTVDNQCQMNCNADLDSCMSLVTSPGGPLPRECAQAFTRCESGCPTQTIGSYQCGGGRAQFLSDVAGVIRNSLLADEAVRENVYRLNYWYFIDPGVATRLDSTDFDSVCGVRTPPNLLTDAPFADLQPVLHSDPCRDIATGTQGVFSSEPTDPGTFLHETGHALFGLADSYCCDGGYWQPRPWPNLYTTLDACQEDARRQGWAVTDCASFNRTSDGTAFWRVDGVRALMSDCSGRFPQCAGGGFNFSRGERRRVIWIFDQLP